MTTNQILLVAAALLLLLFIAFVAMGMQRLKARAAAEIAARDAAQQDAAPPQPVAPPPPAAPQLPAADGPPDDLTRIKGLGPKLAARLSELGVVRYRQIADWTDEQLAAVDAQLGQFQGRPQRDRWQEQARLLASGDVKAFERAHGKLGKDGEPGSEPAA